MPDTNQKVVITGGAGLVGQNLLVLLQSAGWNNITVIDKHRANMELLRRIHPQVTTIEADLAEPGPWQDALIDCEMLVQAHAQIGGLDYGPFEANNITATQRVLEAAQQGSEPFVVHLSSSVVNSLADDFYTRSKTRQEQIVLADRLPHCVLRPTLMFGWFDRKHLGWLSRFMSKVPVFPIPGNGKYLRQPLYVQDFCQVIVRCMERRPAGEIYDISGLQRVDYIDLIKALKKANGAKAKITKIPYGLFRVLLKIYALVDRDPPFTVAQLEALVTPDVFDVIDWPGQFDVEATSLDDALHATFNDPRYSELELAF
ncbi:MAG: NAD-dependent epimerase/dehydratase family protein [Lysobacterales bacterium]